MNKTSAADLAVTDWLSALREFETDPRWEHWREQATSRMILRDLDALLHMTPPDLLQEFDRFDERELGECARDLMGHIGARTVCDDTTSPIEALKRGAILLRALDEYLFEGNERIANEAPECWLTEDRRHFIIPAPRGVLREGGARTGQSYGRRGLLKHRVLPTRTAGVDIVVRLHPDVTGPSTDAAIAQRTIGCAIFDQFTLTYDIVGKDRFLVTSADCHGGIEHAVSHHCVQAREAGCDVLVWPELTIAPAEADTLGAALARHPLETSLPAVVVAGSWHVDEDGKKQNIAPVLDGRGGEIDRIGKNRLFRLGKLTEAVTSHGAIHVIVTDRDLVAFAICKDFCDKAKAVPVKMLDVDLVIVPSMGLANTMTAHREAADTMKVDFGTRSVVSQQTYPVEGSEAPGYILPGLAEPREAELGSLAARTGVTIFQPEGRAVRSGRG